MLDVVHGRRERTLERSHDAAGHLVGRQPGVLPHNADHGNADIRKDVGGRAQRRQRPGDENQQREHHEGIGTLQSDSDQGIHGAAS